MMISRFCTFLQNIIIPSLLCLVCKTKYLHVFFSKFHKKIIFFSVLKSFFLGHKYKYKCKEREKVVENSCALAPCCLQPLHKICEYQSQLKNSFARRKWVMCPDVTNKNIENQCLKQLSLRISKKSLK